MRRALEETKEELRPVFKPHKNLGPTVTELRYIWNDMQNLLEDSAYDGNKIPTSQGNEDDRNAFSLLRTKFQRSKKFRSLFNVIDNDDQAKAVFLAATGSGIGPEMADFMYVLLDQQNLNPNKNIMDIKQESWKDTIEQFLAMDTTFCHTWFLIPCSSTIMNQICGSVSQKR